VQLLIIYTFFLNQIVKAEQRCPLKSLNVRPNPYISLKNRSPKFRPSSDGILYTAPSKTYYQIQNPDPIYEDQIKTFPDRLQAENR
jgi:hypothetical protein